MLQVVFRASANAQVVDAQTWYDQQRHGLGGLESVSIDHHFLSISHLLFPTCFSP
jgi:hypothetical protein